MPTHEGLDLHLPEKCVYAFLEDEIDRFAKTVGANKWLALSQLPRSIRSMLWSTKERKFAWPQAPVGSAPAAQFMDWLIGYGVKKIISAGSCGVLVDIEENAFNPD